MLILLSKRVTSWEDIVRRRDSPWVKIIPQRVRANRQHGTFSLRWTSFMRREMSSSIEEHRWRTGKGDRIIGSGPRGFLVFHRDVSYKVVPLDGAIIFRQSDPSAWFWCREHRSWNEFQLTEFFLSLLPAEFPLYPLTPLSLPHLFREIEKESRWTIAFCHLSDLVIEVEPFYCFFFLETTNDANGLQANCKFI